MKAFDFPLYFVVGAENCAGKDLLWTIEEAIIGGVDLLQLREKHLKDEDFVLLAKKVKAICERYNVPLIVNDNLRVAQEVEAEGIHVGNSDLDPVKIRELWPACKILGYSADLIEHLNNNFAAVSDYLGISPVFKTPTKEDTVGEWGIEGLAQARTLTDKPLVAIGGIHQKEIVAILETGVDSICVVSAIAAHPDPRRAAANIKQQINDYYEKA